MTTSNNLNQLLSRVKTLFGRKARNEKTVETPVQKPLVSDQRLKAALAEVESHLAEHFGTTSSSLTYQDYNNGISLTSDDPIFATAVVIRTQTGGMLNLPDNVILLEYVKTNKGDDYLIQHLGNFIKFLKQIGTKHCIQHIAFAFDKTESDDPHIVKKADVTCLRPY